MKQQMCARCGERPAVIYIQKMEGDEVKPEGLCIQCARELNIGSINQMIDKLGISDEELEQASEQMSQFMENMGDFNFGDMSGMFNAENMDGAQTMPFANLFGDAGELAVDENENLVNEILPYVTDAQIGDSTNENFLESLGIKNYDICFVTIGGNFQNSLETTSLLKELGAKMVISRAERDVQAKFLLRNGADEVIYPEKQIANWAAIRYTADHIHDYIEVDDSHAIFEVEVPGGWIGKTIGELDIRKKYSISILAIKTDGKMNMAIGPDMELSSEDTLLVLGTYKDMQKCFRI